MDLIADFFSNPVLEQIFTWLLIGGLLFIAAIHAYWTVGGKRWLTAAIPVEDGRPAFLPTPAATFTISFGALLAAMVIPGSAGMYTDPQPEALYQWTPWVLAVIFGLRAMGDFRYMGLFRRIGQSRFATWDANFYTPFSIIMCLAAISIGL